MPRAQLLTLEELARLGRCFTALGVTRLRVTGGEPLVRRNVLWLLAQLGAIPGIDLSLTTNGMRLVQLADSIAAAGVKRLNISLDTLHPARFRTITRSGDLQQVLDGIAAAQAAGFVRIKLNSVLINGINQQEAPALVAFAIDQGVDIRFIEEMPLGQQINTPAPRFYPSAAILNDLTRDFVLHPDHSAADGGPARYWQIAGTKTRVGIIAPQSDNFCAQCNRVRVTAAGQLLFCLGHSQSMDLRRLLRAYPSDDQRVQRAIRTAICHKPQGHQFLHPEIASLERTMNATGG